MSGVSDVLTIAGVSGKDAIPGFENYEIVQELPQGGQAIVYKAVHKPTKTHVAIKILLPSLLASTRARYYFEREAELIASLDHPNIVKIRDSGIIHGQYFFVMEYIKGQPLYRYVEVQNLSFRERIVLFDKICEAVTYAHQQGIIHRDLKSANVLVDERGEPHILDFGLAKAIGLGELARKDVMPTITGQWAGSLSSMSPEQAAAKPELIDVRTDVYALGMMLYHILTGQDPYDVTGSVLDVLRNIQGAEPVRPSKIIQKFDPDVEAILLTALVKDRAQRYQSVASLQGDIENWLAGLPITVRSFSTLYLMRKVIARHRYVASVIGLLLVIIFSFSFVSFNLFLTARAAQRNTEGIAKQWSQQAIQLKTEQHRELLASMFLDSPQPLKDKEAEFRQQLGNEQAWFANFIIGEHYLKDGNKEQALIAYRESFQTLQKMQADNQPVDMWCFKKLKAKIYELTAKEEKSGEVSTSQP
jgi:serine/threonine protein kinase